MAEELDVVQLIRTLRFFEGIATRLFTETQVEELRKKTKRLALRIDETDAVSKKVENASQASDSVSKRDGDDSDRMSY